MILNNYVSFKLISFCRCIENLIIWNDITVRLLTFLHVFKKSWVKGLHIIDYKNFNIKAINYLFQNLSISFEHAGATHERINSSTYDSPNLNNR